MNQCPTCGSKNIASGILVVNTLQVVVRGAPIDFSPDKKKLTKMNPNIYATACLECGQIDLKLNPQELGSKLKK